MATKEQTRANKKNARQSTGPRTAEGKAKSSQNALKHGLRAQATVLPDENLDDFEFLVSGLEDQFQPQTALEWSLLRQLADAEWRMRRVPGLEAALFAAKLHETVRHYSYFPERLPEDDAEADIVLIGAAADKDASNGDTLSKLSRYEARLSHRYFKALEHLQKIQGMRRQETNPKQRPQAAPNANEANAKGPAGNETPENEIAASMPATSKPATNSPARNTTGTTRKAAAARPQTGPPQMEKAPRQTENVEADPIAPNEPNRRPQRPRSIAASAWPSPAQAIQPCG